MSFADKVIENQRILKKCKDVSAFNVGASRAYYCAFIDIKRYLISKGYDYNQFLGDIGKTGERVFSHGTVKKALFQCLLEHGNILSNVSQLNVLDNLYWKRRTADYEDRGITSTQFDDSIRELGLIESVLGAAK
ncbi:MAG TPA: hypothetical protein PK786_10755 [Treponemataceae bacterium]|nr:hypothetical protein [Treponemataceae bacterium]